MASTSTTNVQGAQLERVDYRALLWAGPVAIFGAALLNVVVRELSVLLGLVPQDHALLGAIPVFIATAVQVTLGVGLFALLGKVARRPISLFRTIALIALVLSLSQPVMVATGVFSLPAGGNMTFNLAIVITMMAMHVIAGLFTIWTLTTQAREN